MPAEWEKHEATWLGWPHNPTDCRINWIPFAGFTVRSCARLRPGNVCGFWSGNLTNKKLAARYLQRTGGSLKNVEFIEHPTNRGWTRDSGPLFVRRTRPKAETAIVHFHFNAWAKYDDWPKDRKVPETAARWLKKRLFKAQCQGRDFVMEGGGIEVNGAGTLLTTEECYLDPSASAEFGADGADYEPRSELLWRGNVLWLLNGLVGDDTHGHIDDICRFVNPRTLVLVQETNRREVNYRPLAENWERGQDFRLEDGSRPEVVPLPMPAPLYFDGTGAGQLRQFLHLQRRRAGPHV